MPKELKDYHEGIKYHTIRKGNYEPGCYQLHKPYDCRHKFPPTKKPIHKCEIPEKEVIMVPQMGLGLGFRKLIVPSRKKNYYPVVMDKAEFDRLKQQARIVTQEERLEQMHAQEQGIQQAAKESEARKQMLKEKLQKQPGAEAATGTADPELEGPDQSAYTLTRAEMLKADNMQGPRLCNRIILASKCHAIRDAQIVEKDLIKKELDEEQRRLDAIMEENRQAAVARAEAEEERRHRLRLQNLTALKEQINAHETAKIMEAERIEEESIRVNQANIAMQIDEAQKLKEKHARQLRLKEMLDQGNAEILYYKQLQNEEERINDLRIASFLQARQEREAENRAKQNAIKAAKLKGIDHIAKAQKAEQKLKEELDRIRNLKIQEDCEREYRRKERDAAVKRNKDMKNLHEARVEQYMLKEDARQRIRNLKIQEDCEREYRRKKRDAAVKRNKNMKNLHEARVEQIRDIHRNIAREIAKDEQTFNNAARQNEEYLRREKELDDKRKARVERHRQEIMKQINDKERARTELRERIYNQGVALRMELEQQDKYEHMVIKQKLEALRNEKIPEKYVTEVKQTLSKSGYKNV